MPSNPYKGQQQCFASLHKILGKLPKEGVVLQQLLVETLASYPVSRAAVLVYVDDHVSAGFVVLRDGVLYGSS